MHKGVGVGIELLIQLSPRPTPFSDREDDASRVGLGIFKNYSLIRSLGLVARPVQSKSEVEMRLQSRFCLSADLNLSPFKYFSAFQSRSLSLLCQRPNKWDVKARP